jgi:hypothetical protein
VKRTRTGSSGGSRPILIGIVAFSVIAIGLIVAMELVTRGGGSSSGKPEAAVTKAPDDHPTAVTSGGASLHFTTTSIDLGLVPLGKEVGYTFSYANIGAETLRIGDVNVRAVRGC